MVTRARTGRQLRGSKRKSARMFRSSPPSFHELLSILRDNSVTFRFSPASPAKRYCAGKVSESYEFFKIPTQIKKRSNARFLSTLLRYLSSILTIYFCLRDNLGCPLTQDCAPRKHWTAFNYLIKYYHFTSFLSTLLHEKSPGEPGRAGPCRPDIPQSQRKPTAGAPDAARGSPLCPVGRTFIRSGPFRPPA